MEDKYINIKKAAKHLGVSPLTLRNWDKAGKLVAHRHPINNYRVYLLKDLDKFMTPELRPSTPPKKPKIIEKKDNTSYRLKVIHMSD